HHCLSLHISTVQSLPLSISLLSPSLSLSLPPSLTLSIPLSLSISLSISLSLYLSLPLSLYPSLSLSLPLSLHRREFPIHETSTCSRDLHVLLFKQQHRCMPILPLSVSLWMAKMCVILCAEWL